MQKINIRFSLFAHSPSCCASSLSEIMCRMCGHSSELLWLRVKQRNEGMQSTTASNRHPASARVSAASESAVRRPAPRPGVSCASVRHRQVASSSVSSTEAVCSTWWQMHRNTQWVVKGSR
jgi:hypothetical protein